MQEDTPAAARPSQAHLPQLDGVRGLAILMVVACHYLDFPASPLAKLPLMKAASAGWIGVDLFFVLSGFLLGGILMDEKDADGFYRRFYLRRAARILPLYYLCLAWCVLSGWERPGVSYLFFLQNWAIAFARHPPPGGISITWSLAVEEQFYLVLPLLIAKLSKRRLGFLLMGYLVLIPFLRIAARPLFPSEWSIHVLSITHGDSLAMGVLIAMAVRSERVRAFYVQHRLGFTGFAAGLAFYTFSRLFTIGKGVDPRCDYFLTPLAVIFGWLVLDCTVKDHGAASIICQWSPLRFFGRISYCLYLTHWFFFMRLRLWALDGGSIVAPTIDLRFSVVCGLAALGLSLLVCTLSYRYFEQPIIRWARRSNLVKRQASPDCPLPSRSLPDPRPS